jgi:hypothetical protein
MPISSHFFDSATEGIVSIIYQVLDDLEPTWELRHRVDNFTEACRSVAVEGTMIRGITEVRGKEAASLLNEFHTNLRQSIPLSYPNGFTCTAELLESKLGALRQFTEKCINKGDDHAWVQETNESVREDAITETRQGIGARENAIAAIMSDVKSLEPKNGATLTDEESKQLDRLTGAVGKYAARARLVNGPTVDFVTSGAGGESHHALHPEDASQLMGAMNLALRRTTLEPLADSPSFNKQVLASIADSAVAIERATDEILVAHEKLGDTEQYGGPMPTIEMGEVEYWTAKNLYERALIADELTQMSTSASGAKSHCEGVYANNGAPQVGGVYP